MAADIIVGIDAGTSVIKAVAFDIAGTQIAAASVPNRYATGADGSATQSLAATWADCALALRNLGLQVNALAARTAPVPRRRRARRRPRHAARQWLRRRATVRCRPGAGGLF